MNKALYTLLICLLGLTVAAGMIQSIIYFQLGAGMFWLEAFGPWFLMVSIASFLGSFLLLKYFHYKKHWFTFSAGVISLIAAFCYAGIVYSQLVWGKSGTYYIPALFIWLVTSIVYALSLMFSNSAKESWLKAGGIFMFINGLVILSGVIWSLVSHNTISERVSQWTSMTGSLAPLFFIMQFRIELRYLKNKNTVIPGPRYFTSLFSILGLMVFVLVVGCGVTLAMESSSSMYWGKRNFEKTKQLAQLFEARNFVNSSGDTLLYRLLKPLHYDRQKKYPLVICLPYGGQPGTDKIRQLEGAAVAQLLSTDINRKKYPAFLFVPNCPPGSGWGGVPNYPTVDTLVYEAIIALDKEPGIDVKKRYVTGISRGGYGTWHFICTRPELFAAAIPVCGGEDPKLAANALDVAVWAFHGTNDRNVPVSGSRNMIAALKKAGGNPKYTEFKDEGHNIWYKVSITPGLFDWLFAQSQD